MFNPTFQQAEGAVLCGEHIAWCRSCGRSFDYYEVAPVECPCGGTVYTADEYYAHGWVERACAGGVL